MRFWSLFLLLALPFMCFSQRIAVLEFKPGVGVSTADVDGLSSIFVTYFAPQGYTLVERSQIDRVIDEQKFQRSTLTENQMVRIGEILNLSKIVVGSINVIRGEYNVDVRVINVESGAIAATEGACFISGKYRDGMKNIAIKLANQIDIANNIEYVSQQNQPLQDSTLPPSLLLKLSKQPKKLSVALIYDGNLYFADKTILKELFNYPNVQVSPIAVMAEGGEDAFGIAFDNIGDKMYIDEAWKYRNSHSPWDIMYPDEANIILQNIDQINEIFNLLDESEMTNVYWCGDMEIPGTAAHVLDLQDQANPIKYISKDENRWFRAFIRPIFNLKTLRKMSN